MGSGEEGVKIDEQIILGKCRHAEHSNGNQVSIIFTIRANYGFISSALLQRSDTKDISPTWQIIELASRKSKVGRYIPAPSLSLGMKPSNTNL